jgi:hypothetical protein
MEAEAMDEDTESIVIRIIFLLNFKYEVEPTP